MSIQIIFFRKSILARTFFSSKSPGNEGHASSMEGRPLDGEHRS